MNFSSSSLPEIFNSRCEERQERISTTDYPQPMIMESIHSDRVFSLESGLTPLMSKGRMEEGRITACLEKSTKMETGISEEEAVKSHCVLAEDNGDAETMARLAHLYANQGKLEEARIWGEKAIAQDRLNPRHYYLLASILQEQSKKDEAITLLKQTLYLEADFILAHFSLGNLAMQQRRYREAEKHFDNVLALLEQSPDDEIIPVSEGVSAGSLREMVENIRYSLAGKEKIADKDIRDKEAL